MDAKRLTDAELDELERTGVRGIDWRALFAQAREANKLREVMEKVDDRLCTIRVHAWDDLSAAESAVCDVAGIVRAALASSAPAADAPAPQALPWRKVEPNKPGGVPEPEQPALWHSADYDMVGVRMGTSVKRTRHSLDRHDIGVFSHWLPLTPPTPLAAPAELARQAGDADAETTTTEKKGPVFNG